VKKYSLIVMAWGAGVQSTAVSLMHRHNPELLESIGLTPSCYIFSDPGAEFEWTHQHIDRLLLQDHFAAPLYGVSNGDILADNGTRTLPPYYVRKALEDGSPDMSERPSVMLRKCTSDLKIIPNERMARSLAGLTKGKRGKKGSICLLKGISLDEVERMKPGVGVFDVRYPLIELRWDRNKCKQYCIDILGYHVQRSACWMCPFRRDWQKMATESPKEFALAIDYDKSLRDGRRSASGSTGIRYIHRYGLPLEEAIWQEKRREATKGELLFNDFINECEGHCGV